MTGPEHYAEAERLAGIDPIGGNLTAAQASALLIAAQVHATLALAAATAFRQADGTTYDGSVWYDVVYGGAL